MRHLGLIFAAAAVVGLAIACTSASNADKSTDTGSATASEQLIQSGTAGAVEVEARWLAAGDVPSGFDLARYPPEKYWLLDVKLDTHSGDLGSIDLRASTQLTVGTTTQDPLAWVSGKDDSHHREGVLVFEGGDETGPVQLVLRLPDGDIPLLWANSPGT